jgi:hypothetical protein
MPICVEEKLDIIKRTEKVNALISAVANSTAEKIK